MDLSNYRSFGRSGLIVSPLALGTMTFGTKRWGTDAAGSRAVYDAYVGAGGNFIDTADVYTSGVSEELLGGFIADSSARERIVIATKSGFGTAKHPNAGGNGAKHVHDAVEGSLRRLRTDHIDLYWLHVWDMVTPAEEVLQTMAGLIRAGKLRYYGLSNVPAWYAARLATLAAAHGLPAPIGLQFEYSLVERGIEGEHLPMAAALGLGMQPWSPLGGGFLSGKYRREEVGDGAGRTPELPDGSSVEDASGEGRLAGANPFGDTKFNDRNWGILAALREVAGDAGATPAQVALSWLVARPGVASILIGASSAEQVAANVTSLAVTLSSAHRERLDAASAPVPAYPSALFSPAVRRFVFGGNEVAGWRE